MIKKYSLYATFIFLLPFFFNSQSCAPKRPVNLTLARNAVENYYECGQYDADMNKVIAKAISHFKSIPATEKSVVIFDIDDTILSSYCDEKSIKFGYVPKLLHEWVLHADAPQIPQTFELYSYLVKRGFHIIFLTGRRHDEYDATIKNMRREGYTTFDKLIVRSIDQEKLSAQKFKANKRKELTKQGYIIVGSVGDQWSDLLGGYACYKVKLPNYRYILD
jgi:acid phosphatase